MATPYKILIMGACMAPCSPSSCWPPGTPFGWSVSRPRRRCSTRTARAFGCPSEAAKDWSKFIARAFPARCRPAAPEATIRPSYDLVALAMQEPQYRSPDVRELLDAIAQARVPCMSIMNMPPPPYLARIPGLAADALRDCYTDPACGTASTRADDAVQPGPASVSSAGGKDQRAAGPPAHQLQGRAL